MSYRKINKAKAIDLYTSGYSEDEIAQQFACARTTIIDVLTEAGVYVPASEGKKKIDKGKIRALRKAGWLLSEIALDCYCSIADVEEVLNETQNNPA